MGDSTRQKFTGYEADAQTGLNFAQARYQSSVQGRFTSVDPLGASASTIDPQSLNRYSYVQNNPTSATDPSGMMIYDGSMGWGDVAGLWMGGDPGTNRYHLAGLTPSRKRKQDTIVESTLTLVATAAQFY